MPREGLEVDPKDVVWEGRIGNTPLRVSVSHAERIVAEWDSPGGARHKVASSMEEFERSVLFQLLISAGGDESSTKEVVAAVAKAQGERPPPAPDPSAQRRRKTPKVRQHRRSRTPPRRR
ncbi:MAG TPA: hypothetical protein VHJ82_04135 [Actinomycetota bacterium]|nr:hypothetical protein [Actinomycetota bacterium]